MGNGEIKEIPKRSKATNKQDFQLVLEITLLRTFGIAN